MHHGLNPRVCPDSVRLALVDGDLGSNVQKGILGVVQTAVSVSVALLAVSA